MRRNLTRRCLKVALSAFAIWTVSAGYGQAATLEWLQQFGTSADDRAAAIAADRFGNVYVGGSTGGDLGGPRVGTNDVFLRKFDSAGQLQWSRQFGSKFFSSVCYGISAAEIGSVYVAGASLGSGGFLSKFDADGNLEWSRQVVTSGSAFVRGVSADGLGNVFITGNKNNRDNFLAKYDADGSLQWEQALGVLSYAVAADQLGNVFVTGTAQDNVFVKKFDGTGVLDWTQTFGTRAQNIGVGASIDGLGNVYISGVSSTGVTFAPFVSKVNTLGIVDWTRELYSVLIGDSVSLLQSIYLYSDPNIAVSADGNRGIYTSESGGLSQFYRLTKFDAAGNLAWAQSLTSPDLRWSPVVSNDGMGNAYIAGATFGNLGGTNFGGQDALVVKFSDPSVPEPAAWQLLTIILMACLYRRRLV